MPYDQSIFGNMPIYAQLSDDAGVLQHICDSIQPEFDAVIANLDRQPFFYNYSITPREFIVWLGQFVGLASVGDRWQGIGINPDWPEAHQRRMIGEAWNYWRIKGTEPGIRKAVELWLRLDFAQNRDRFQIRLPFGKAPTATPPNWWGWGTPYDAHLLQTYAERQHFGGDDTPNQLYQPNWSKVEAEIGQWNYEKPGWNQYELIQVRPRSIPGKGSKLGPARPWMHLLLTEATWNRAIPDVFALNQEAWSVHADPTVFAWLSFPGPADPQTDGGIPEAAELTVELVESPITPRHDTVTEIWVDGHQWGEQYPSPARNPIQGECTETIESAWGMAGAQYTDPVGGLDDPTDWNEPGTPYFVQYAARTDQRRVPCLTDPGIPCQAGIEVEVQIGTELRRVPGRPAIPPNQLFFISRDNGAFTLENGLGLLLEDSIAACLGAVAIVMETGDALVMEDADTDTGAEPVVFLMDSDADQDLCVPPILIDDAGFDVLNEDDTVILLEGDCLRAPILLDDLNTIVVTEQDTVILLGDDDRYEDPGNRILTLKDTEQVEVMSETDDLPILLDDSETSLDRWDDCANGKCFPCAEAIVLEDGETPFWSEDEQIFIEEGDSPYVCVGCLAPTLTEDGDRLLTEDNELLVLDTPIPEVCPCPGMNLVLLEDYCGLLEPVRIATYFDVDGRSPMYYFGGCPGEPDTYEEVPVTETVRLCNTFDHWSTATILDYRQTVIEVPEQNVDLYEVYPELVQASRSAHWTLMIGTETSFYLVNPSVMFWVKPGANVEQVPPPKDRGHQFSTQQGLTQLWLEFVTEFEADRKIQFVSLLAGDRLVKQVEYEALLNAPKQGCYGFRYRINFEEPALVPT